MRSTRGSRSSPSYPPIPPSYRSRHLGNSEIVTRSRAGSQRPADRIPVANARKESFIGPAFPPIGEGSPATDCARGNHCDQSTEARSGGRACLSSLSPTHSQSGPKARWPCSPPGMVRCDTVLGNADEQRPKPDVKSLGLEAVGKSSAWLGPLVAADPRARVRSGFLASLSGTVTTWAMPPNPCSLSSPGSDPGWSSASLGSSSVWLVE